MREDGFWGSRQFLWDYLGELVVRLGGHHQYTGEDIYLSILVIRQMLYLCNQSAHNIYSHESRLLLPPHTPLPPLSKGNWF